MIHFKKSVFSLLLLSAFYCKAQDAMQRIVDSIATSYLKHHAGAMVVGISDNGIEKFYYYGETEKGNNKLPDNNCVFELGGFTETFTCALYADMSVKGMVKPDSKLQELLPVSIPGPVYQTIICKRVDETNYNIFNEMDRPGIHYTPYVCFPDPSTRPQQILLCDLGTHTTGLPENPGNLKRNKSKQNPYGNYTKDNLYDFIKNYTFDRPMGYDYKHSALGIALLGHALSLKSEKSYDSLIVERLFTPLQMNDTRINLSTEQQQRLISGHCKKGKVVPHWTFDVLAPAGGLHSTPSDMMKFLSANITREKNYYADLLDYTHNARLQLTGKKNKNKEIALGWKINPLDGDKKIVWQSGITGGFASYIGIVETSHTGVFVLLSIAKDASEMGEQLLLLLERGGYKPVKTK